MELSKEFKKVETLYLRVYFVIVVRTQCIIDYLNPRITISLKFGVSLNISVN